MLIKQCQQSGYECFCTPKQHLYFAKKIFLETLNPNQHPHTKILFFCYTIIFLSQMENQKALKISIVNTSSGSLYHGYTLIQLELQPCKR